VSIACGLASIQHDTIEVRLNGSAVWNDVLVGQPTAVVKVAAVVNQGRNTLEFVTDKEALRHPRDPRPLGFSVYDLAVTASARE